MNVIWNLNWRLIFQAHEKRKAKHREKKSGNMQMQL